MFKFLPRITLPLLCLAPLAAAADPSYSITFLPHDFHASAMNNAGQVVGTTFGGPGSWTAAIWSEAGMTSLAAVAPRSWGYGINDRGEVVGTTDEGAKWRAFTYADGTLHKLDTSSLPNWAWDTSGRAINDAGMIIGETSNMIGEHGRAFVYNNGQATIIESFGGSWTWPRALSNTGYVVGDSTTTAGPPLGEDYHAFLFKDGTAADLGTLGGARSSGLDVNDAGQVVGWAGTGIGPEHPVLYQDGKMTDLGTLGGDWGEALGINNAGMAVGVYGRTGTQGRHAFLYLNGQIADLSSLVGDADGWDVVSASEINDRQQILGSACRAGVCETVLLNPVLAVPEPSMAALLLAGLGAATVRRLRRAGPARAGA
jgi:probable HAF family extracellular repeat protein